MRRFLTALVAVFLCLPASAQDVTPNTPLNCPVAQDMNAFFELIDRNDQGLVRTILSPEASDAYMAAFNAIPPATDYPGDTVAFYEREGISAVYLVMIVGDVVCRHGQIPRNIHERALHAAAGV